MDSAPRLSLNESHVRLAHAVRKHLDAHMDRRITLAQLSERFHASGTQIKAAYRETFGVSVYADTRARKMREAGRLLRETGLSVLEIAGRLGYDNASKFAAAFRAVMGVTPLHYRKGKEE